MATLGLGLSLVLGAAVAGAGCSSPDEPTGTPTSSTAAPSTAPPGDDGESGDDDGGTGGSEDADDGRLRGDALDERLAGLGGQLAIGNGPAMAVARPDGGALQVLADGQETGAQPTWSPDGASLAWSSTSPERQVLLVQGFDEAGEPDGPATVSDAPGFPLFYLQWADDGDRLAYLRNGSAPGTVEFGLVRPGDPIERVAEGTPFFIAWSPASDEVAAHVAQERVERYDADRPTDAPTVVVDQGTDYSAPAWVDEDRLLLVVDDALSLVSVADGTVEALAPVDGPIRFVVSPDGRRVAYRLLADRSQGPLTASLRSASLAASTSTSTGDDGDEEDAPVDGDDDGADRDEGLVVLDLETGERTLVGDDTVTAWEWSPDGSRLAWLSLERGVRPVGAWRFWAVDGRDLATDTTPDFSLTRKYAEVYLPFFAQYTHSVTGWAPDGSAFAFPGSIQGDAGIWVQLIDEAAEAARISVGDMVTWGPGPTPDDGGGASAA